MQRKEKNEQDTGSLPRSRAVRAAYAVRTLDDDQIKEATVPKDYGQKNTMLDDLEIEQERKIRRKKRASSASVARRRKRKLEASSSRGKSNASNTSLDML